MASSQPDPENMREYDIFLLGKTGTGKSATGNSILRNESKKRYFKSSSDPQSVTFEIQREWALVDGHYVKVVDGPGLAENRMDEVEAGIKARKDMCEAMGICGLGFHALALVFKFGDRFTAEQKMCVRLLRSFFGQDFLSQYGVIILTFGENFANSMEEEDTPGRSFDNWCRGQKGELQNLFKECNYRVVLFNNAARNEAEVKHQRQQLFAKIDSLGGRRYSNKVFKQIQKARNGKIEETKDLQFKEEVMKKSSIIDQKLREIYSEFSAKENYKHTLQQLKVVEREAKDLLEEISSSDRGSRRVEQMKEEVARILRKVESHREQVECCQETSRQLQEAEARKEAEELQKRLADEKREKEKLATSKKELEDAAKQFDSSRQVDKAEENNSFTGWLGGVAWQGVQALGYAVDEAARQWLGWGK